MARTIFCLLTLLPLNACNIDEHLRRVPWAPEHHLYSVKNSRPALDLALDTSGRMIARLPTRTHGTGFLLKYHAAGWFNIKHFVVTAWHVIQVVDGLPGENEISLMNAGSKTRLPWTNAAGNKAKDLALLDVDFWSIHHLVLYQGARLKTGTPVAVMGLKSGVSEEYVKIDATITATDIPIDRIRGSDTRFRLECFRLDKPLPPGMSGSPVLHDGRVAGIVIATGEDYSLAISTRYLKDALANIAGEVGQ